MQPLQVGDRTASADAASASHAALVSDCNGGAAAELADITMTASMWLSSSDANPPLPPACLEAKDEKGCGGNIDIAETLVRQIVVAIERQIEKMLAKHHQELLSSMRLFMDDRVLKESGSSGSISEANPCTTIRKRQSGRFFREGSGQCILNRVKNGNDGCESPNRWISEGSSRATSKDVHGVADVSGLPYSTEDSNSVGSSRSYKMPIMKTVLGDAGSSHTQIVQPKSEQAVFTTSVVPFSVLHFNGTNRRFFDELARSSLRRELESDGWDTRPPWANGATVFVRDCTPQVLQESGMMLAGLRPWNVVVSTADESRLRDVLLAIPRESRPHLSPCKTWRSAPTVSGGSVTALLETFWAATRDAVIDEVVAWRSEVDDRLDTD